MAKISAFTEDLYNQKFRILCDLFPEAVTESKGDSGQLIRSINADILSREISAPVINNTKQSYSFTWPDKNLIMSQAAQPTTKTLRPIREKSSGKDSTPGNFDSENIYIEGDNLDALKILRETYLRQIKLIYIDPPYNTGHDFIYQDNFSENQSEHEQKSGQRDSEGNRLVQNKETDGKFHTNWLNMIYPRLRIARDLLSDDGVIFISIDDNESANLRKICDEIFGEKNFIACLVWKSKSGGAMDSRFFAVDQEYIMVYAKNVDSLTINHDTEATITTSYNRRDEYGEYALERLDKQSLGYIPSLDFEIIAPDGKSYFPQHKDPAHPNARWRWSREKVAENYDKLVFENGNVYTKNYKKDSTIARSLLIDERFGRTRTGKTDLFALFKRDYFSSPKPYKLIEYIVQLAANNDSIILDFFSGSATTAHAVMSLNAQDGGNRKFILVQIPEETPANSEAFKAGYKTICEIGQERIRRAGRKIRDSLPLTTNGLDTGFRVFRVDSSNIKDVYLFPEEFKQDTIELFADNIKPDRTPDDLLIHSMLRLGINLSAKIDIAFTFGKKIFIVNDNYLIACFDDNITENTVIDIAKRRPNYAVFRDSGMANDSVMTNFEQIFKTYSSDTKRSVI